MFSALDWDTPKVSFFSSTFPVFTSLNFFAWQSATVTCYHIPHQILAEGYKVGIFLLTFFWLCNERSSLIKDWAWASIKDVSSFFPIFWHPQPQCRNVFPLLSVSKFQGYFDPSPSKLPTSFMDGLLHKIRQKSGVDFTFYGPIFQASFHSYTGFKFEIRYARNQ